jgi:hypothetical protein
MRNDRTPRTIYLVGTTGHPNYGDELIAATWLKYLAAKAPDAEVWLDCPSPGPSAVLLGHLHPHVRFTDTLWRLCWEPPSDDPWEVSAFVQRAVQDPGLAPHWVAGVELAARADLVHVIGGGYINGIWPRHVGLLAGAVAAVRRSGGRAVMTGQGLWPFPDGTRTLLHNLAADFAVVDVRDEVSAEILQSSHEVSSTGDDLFFGIEPSLYRSSDDLPEVMVCLQSDLLDTGVPALAGFLLDTLRHWGARPEQVGVVEGIPRGDREVYALVEHHLQGARFYPFSDIMEHGLPAAAGQRWLSTRFHMHMVAAAAGASGVAVSINSDYYTTKHRSLLDRGSNWDLSEKLSIVPSPHRGGFESPTLRQLRKAKGKLAERIYSH